MLRLLTRLLLGLVLVVGLMAGRGFAHSSAPSDISVPPSQSGSTAVTAEHEIQGLDLSQHGEEGYNLEV